MYNYSVGGFWNRKNFLLKLKEIEQHKRNWLLDDISINSSFDCFPNCVWNGGRVSVGPQVSKNDIIDTFKLYNDLNVQLRLTFTNSLITKESVYDNFGNLILEIAAKNKGVVICQEGFLKDYIKSNYPEIKLISSVTQYNTNPVEISRKLNSFDLLVWPFTENKNLDLLNSIDQKEKLEILVNNYCKKDCPYITEHYKLLSSGQLTYNDHIDDDWMKYKCPVSLETTKKYDNLLSREEIEQLKKEIGIVNFKVADRLYLSSFDQINVYFKYLIKEQYRKEFLKFFID